MHITLLDLDWPNAVVQTKQKPGDVLGGNADAGASGSEDDEGAGAAPRFDEPDIDSEVDIGGTPVIWCL